MIKIGVFILFTQRVAIPFVYAFAKHITVCTTHVLIPVVMYVYLSDMFVNDLSNRKQRLR